MKLLDEKYNNSMYWYFSCLFFRYIHIVSNWCIHSLKHYFSATKWDRNTICVVFYSLNFLKFVHIQNVHLLPQYTPNNRATYRLDCCQWDIIDDMFKISWALDFLVPIWQERCFNDFFWGSCKNLHDCIVTLFISETSPSSALTFQHI